MNWSPTEFEPGVLANPTSAFDSDDVFLDYLMVLTYERYPEGLYYLSVFVRWVVSIMIVFWHR